MNMINKILTAVALVFVIIASGIYIIKNTGSKSSPPDKSEVVTPPVDPPSGEKEAGKPERRTVGTTTASPDPVVIENPANDSLQPKYEPINRPEVLQNLREEGKTYKSHVLGKVTGSAFKKDWGVTETSHFEYVYGFTSVGKILKNDGMTIIEERTFENVVDNVLVSEVVFGFDLPTEKIGIAVGTLALLGVPVDPATTIATVQEINEIKIPVSTSALQKLSPYMPDVLDVEKIKNKLKIFTHDKGGLLLMGKTVRITFKDGEGISKIEPVNCTLTPEEVDAIKRSNYVMDHYLMPDREVRVGEKWNVRADVFAGLLDTHIKGDVEGGIQVERGADFRKKDGKLNYRLKLSDGNVVFRSREEGNVITGKLTGLKGTSIMPHENGVISEATMRGYAEYNKLSTDHLLFEAKMAIQPSFEVKYECEVIEEGGN